MLACGSDPAPPPVPPLAEACRPDLPPGIARAGCAVVHERASTPDASGGATAGPTRAPPKAVVAPERPRAEREVEREPSTLSWSAYSEAPVAGGEALYLGCRLEAKSSMDPMSGPELRVRVRPPTGGAFRVDGPDGTDTIVVGVPMPGLDVGDRLEFEVSELDTLSHDDMGTLYFVFRGSVMTAEADHVSGECRALPAAAFARLVAPRLAALDDAVAAADSYEKMAQVESRLSALTEVLVVTDARVRQRTEEIAELYRRLARGLPSAEAWVVRSGLTARVESFECGPALAPWLGGGRGRSDDCLVTVGINAGPAWSEMTLTAGHRSVPATVVGWEVDDQLYLERPAADGRPHRAFVRASDPGGDGVRLLKIGGAFLTMPPRERFEPRPRSLFDIVLLRRLESVAAPTVFTAIPNTGVLARVAAVGCGRGVARWLARPGKRVNRDRCLVVVDVDGHGRFPMPIEVRVGAASIRLSPLAFRHDGRVVHTLPLVPRYEVLLGSRQADLLLTQRDRPRALVAADALLAMPANTELSLPAPSLFERWRRAEVAALPPAGTFVELTDGFGPTRFAGRVVTGGCGEVAGCALAVELKALVSASCTTSSCRSEGDRMPDSWDIELAGLSETRPLTVLNFRRGQTVTDRVFLEPGDRLHLLLGAISRHPVLFVSAETDLVQFGSFGEAQMRLPTDL